jgi:hypothetical protein
MTRTKPIKHSALAVFSTTSAKVAITYWIIVLSAFGVLQGAGFDLAGEGATPIVLLTVPWSLLLINGSLSSSAGFSPQVIHKLESVLGIFVLFPILCGGLNAAVLFGLVSMVQKRRRM